MPLPPYFASILLQELVDASKHKAAPGDHSLPEPTKDGERVDSHLVGQRVIAEASLRLEFSQLDNSIVLHIMAGYQMYMQPSMNL